MKSNKKNLRCDASIKDTIKIIMAFIFVMFVQTSFSWEKICQFINKNFAYTFVFGF